MGAGMSAASARRIRAETQTSYGVFMATMIPASLPEDATEGERRLYRFLEKLPVFFTAWINPSLDGETADFVLYTPKNGLIVLEVKDWALDQVVSADRNVVRLRLGWKEENRTCPFGQSQHYLNLLKAMFQKPGGKEFLLPLQCGVVLPNMRRADYEERLRRDPLISELTSSRTTLFQEELEALERASDKGGFFQNMLNERFPCRFFYEHGKTLVQTVERKLGHAVIMQIPGVDWQSGEKRLVTLDEEQEKAALRFTGGRRLLRGAAGCGKTLILARRAEEILKKSPSAKVLFLCFNLSLAGYIRRMLAERALPLGTDGVEVMPVFDLMARILGDKVEEKENADYYRTVQAMAVEELEAGHELCGIWDAVLVDEAQDFTPMMVRAVTLLLREDTSLLAAMDAEQHLYAESSPETWLNMPGMKTFSLKNRYRSTRQIAAFAEDWLDAEVYAPDKELGVLDGDMPEVRYASGREEAAAMAASGVADMRRSGLPQGEMAVLYARTDGNLPHLLLDALARRGMMTLWPSEDERAKRRYDITTDSVTVSTIHSMKGMDFACVTLVLPLSLAEDREHLLLRESRDRRAFWERRRERGMTRSEARFHALVYVGMTRARRQLTVIWYDDGKKSGV